MWMFTKEKGEGRHQVYLGHAALMAGVQAQLQAVGKQSSLNILQNHLKWNKNYKSGTIAKNLWKLSGYGQYQYFFRLAIQSLEK